MSTPELHAILGCNVDYVYEYVNVTCVCTCICSFHASWLWSVDGTCHYTVTLQTPGEANDMPYILHVYPNLGYCVGCVLVYSKFTIYCSHVISWYYMFPMPTLSCTPLSAITWSTLRRLVPSGHCTEARLFRGGNLVF